MNQDHPTGPFPYEHFCNYFPQYNPEKNTGITAEFVVSCGLRAMMYLSEWPSAWLNGARREYALCLLAAHIIYLTNKEAGEATSKGGNGIGGVVGVGPVTSASVGGVSVSMMTPTTSSDGAFEWWLNKSPYGQEFLAIVRTRGPMVAFVGSKTPVLPLR
jgi:hypothetical protein